MHGSFFVQLQHYICEIYGHKTWEEVYRSANIAKVRSYFLLSTYPDEQFSELIEGCTRATGISRAAILDDFGRYYGKYLLHSYSIMVKSSWKTLDVIEKFHYCFKLLTSVEQSGLTQKNLIIERAGPYELTVHYSNKMQGCELFIGVVHGFADYFHEAITIEHPKCMHAGNAECVIEISKIPAKQLMMRLREESETKKESVRKGSESN